MAVEKTDISRDLINHPGETIADVLEARNMTKSELAVRTGFSPAFIDCVIAGRADISSEFATALEYALEIPKSFWLNLQAKYEAEILEYEKATIISDDYDKISKLEWQDELILLKSRLDLAEKERLAGTPGYSLEEVRNKLMEKFKNADGGIK